MVQGASLKKERERGRQRGGETERERVSENHPEKNELNGDDQEIRGVRGSYILLLRTIVRNRQFREIYAEFTGISPKGNDMIVMSSGFKKTK